MNITEAQILINTEMDSKNFNLIVEWIKTISPQEKVEFIIVNHNHPINF